MLQNSFVLLDGIGSQREISLWKQGITTWEGFIEGPRPRGISSEKKKEMDSELIDARQKLEQRNSAYFAARMSPRELWRCLGEFGRSVAFLDIETTGLSLRSPITLVGIYDGTRTHTLIRGRDLNLQNLRAILGSVDMIVTFNGASFDLPMIESQFPGIVPQVPHVDLRYPLRRLGLVGGLKRIERELSIQRDRRVEYMTGEDAVYLWRLWERHGKRNALDLLVEYNTEDCRNLKILADHAYRSLKRRTFDAVAGKVEYSPSA
jgi:uncharacterized protein YprB with RNaseH-like and TPR domain